MKLLLLALALAFTSASAQETITLPQPQKDAPMTLMQALKERRSVRNFTTDPVTDQQLSELLWAACGINRPDDKKLTAPSAMNQQDIKVYVCRADGSYLYLPATHQLQRVGTKDLRATLAGRQASVAQAPIFLVLVSDQTPAGRVNAEVGNVDCGYVSQNICLAATALGLATVPRGARDRETLMQELAIEGPQLIILNHPVGHEQK